MPIVSFKDFTPVQYTGGESEMQDRYAHKRHHGVVGEEAPKAEKPTEDPKLAARLDRARGHEMAKAHHKKLGPDPQSPAELKKRGHAPVSEDRHLASVSRIRARMHKNGLRRNKRISER